MNMAESRFVDDDDDAQRIETPSPVAQHSQTSLAKNRERDSCPESTELATTLSSPAVKEYECEIDDNLKNTVPSSKKKKKKKKKKRNPGPSEATSTINDENFQGEDSTTSNSTVSQLPAAEVGEEANSATSVFFEDDEKEETRQSTLPSKKKKKKKKKNKTPGADSDVLLVKPICDNNPGSSSNDRVRTVEEAGGIKSDAAKNQEDRKSEPDESSQHQLLTTSSGQNKTNCQDLSIKEELTFKVDSSGKNKPQRQKKQEIGVHVLSDSGGGAVVLPVGTEIKHVNLQMVAPDEERIQRSCGADVTPEKLKNKSEAECEVSATGGETEELSNSDKTTSSTTQSLREE